MSVPPIAFRLFNLIYHQNSHTLITVIQFRMTDWANDASQGIEINRSANDLIQVKAENWFTKVGFHKTLTVSVNYPQLMSQSIPYYILKIFEFTHSGYVSQDTRLKSCISRSWLVDWSFCVEVRMCVSVCVMNWWTVQGDTLISTNSLRTLKRIKWWWMTNKLTFFINTFHITGEIYLLISTVSVEVVCRFVEAGQWWLGG